MGGDHRGGRDDQGGWLTAIGRGLIFGIPVGVSIGVALVGLYAMLAVVLGWPL